MLPRQVEILLIPNYYNGINLVDSPNSLPPTQALKLQNYTFGDSNFLEIKKGCTKINTITTGSAKVDGVFRYSNEASKYYNIGVAAGLFATFEDDDVPIYHTLTATATATAGMTAFATGYPSTWQPYLALAYHGNGSDNQMCYRHAAWLNGFNLRRTGCPLPTATTASTTATTGTGTAGGNLPDGVYKFLFTLELNDGIVCESNPNATALSSTLTADGKITISITNPDSERLRQTCNIYATDTGGDVYYYLTAMSITATGAHTYDWTDYTVLDTGTEIETDNYRPPIGSINRLFNNHMLIAGVAAHPNYVYVSKFMRFEQFPGNVSGGDPVSSAYIIDCEEKIMGMRMAGNGGMLIICENSVRLLTGYSSENFSCPIISMGTSCASSESIAVGNDGRVFWMGRDDVYASDGNQIFKIGRVIWPELSGLNLNDFARINCFFYNQKYNVCYPSAAGTAYCNRRLEFDTRYPDSELGLLGAWTGPHKMESTMSWYNYYGPNGISDVVKIGDLYIASSKTGTGCFTGGAKTWANATSWASGLDWLGKTDWRLPSKVELSAICAAKTSLVSYYSDKYWSSGTYGEEFVYAIDFADCSIVTSEKAEEWYVRAVRDVPTTADADVTPLETIACFTKSRKESETTAYFGSGSGSYILQYDYGSSDNGIYITAIAHSGIMYVGAPMLTKRFHTVVCEIRPTGAQPIMNIEIDNGKTVLKPFILDTSVGSTVWVVGTTPYWGGAGIVWGGTSYEYFKHGLEQEAVGDCIQLKIICVCKNADGVADRTFALRSLGTTYSVIRRFWR